MKVKMANVTERLENTVLEESLQTYPLYVVVLNIIANDANEAVPSASPKLRMPVAI
eukprot:CAMPEP_0194451116 /NCGR_PEP_ID=MMETSP0176-20130528/131128_1 /TAXON_ID=216777 /ORGANISM="Proboscia alata, Strain PI-D3" /LENGTH=55 /DNA_ID=CAMNT_0039278527 /DNA_START=336 /DNA_END=503 /DNA_ORIENTATION=-